MTLPWHMTSDDAISHRKFQALIDMGQPGLAAIGVWVMAGSFIQREITNGDVEASFWRQIGDRRQFTKLAQLLVDVGLWETRDPDGYRFHDWADIGYSTKAQVQLRRGRTKEMKDPRITEAVKARDGDLCRYCGRRVDWKQRNTDGGATYDHVVPGLVAGASNLVVSCRRCNQRKAQRTPEQAGMELRPPPFGPDSDRTKSRLTVQTSSYPPRNRSGIGQDEVSDQVDEQGPAGRTPEVPLAEGHTGSPWHNHRGKPPANLDETRCAVHGTELPCTSCPAQHYAEESST
ncbi:hypothetical protein BH10ACT8_BH10ACT8_18090 [soil metagenome]